MRVHATINYRLDLPESVVGEIAGHYGLDPDDPEHRDGVLHAIEERLRERGYDYLDHVMDEPEVDADA